MFVIFNPIPQKPHSVGICTKSGTEVPLTNVISWQILDGSVEKY